LIRGKKSQSAIEFLMTYGWAFLMIFAVIAVFVNLNINKPTQYISENCYFSGDFNCVEYVANKIGNDVILKVYLSNSVGHRVKINSISTQFLSTISGNMSYQVSDIPYAVDETIPIIIKVSDAQVGEDLLSANIDVRYQVQLEGYFERVSKGNVVVKIQ
jgi:hypothetical protein